MLEVPEGRYPLTRAVVNLTTLLLAQQSTWGPVPSLVGFTLHRCAHCAHCPAASSLAIHCCALSKLLRLPAPCSMHLNGLCQ